MPDNIPLDNEVEGNIVYPLSDETGIRINGTLETWLGKIYETLLDNGASQIYEELLGIANAIVEFKDSVGSKLDDMRQSVDDTASTISTVGGTIDTRLDGIRQSVDDNSGAVSTVNGTIDTRLGDVRQSIDDNSSVISAASETIDAKLGQVKESIDDNGAVAKVIDDTLNARLEDIYEALLDDGYELPTATDSLLGGVKIDLDTIQIRDGVISVVDPLKYMTGERVVQLTPFDDVSGGGASEDSLSVDDDDMLVATGSPYVADDMLVLDGFGDLLIWED